MSDDPNITARRRALRIAAVVGVVAALVCQSLPPKYHTACNAVLDVANIACGVK